MLRRLVAVLAAVVGSAVPAGTAAADAVPPGGEGTAGPPYPYTTELMGQFELIPLKDQAMITRTEYGYLYRAGQQDTHLVVTPTTQGLLFVDTGTERFKRLGRGCAEQEAEVGVAAVCRVRKGVTTERPLLLEIWPRLGDDFVDGSSLPATFAMTVLGDAGTETVRLGAGPDFFNGFTGHDRVWGGAGNDWVRSGLDDDTVWGEAGDDQLVGVEGDDTFYGGEGDDRLGGGPGRDRLDGGADADFILCDSEDEIILAEPQDRLLGCKSA